LLGALLELIEGGFRVGDNQPFLFGAAFKRPPLRFGSFRQGTPLLNRRQSLFALVSPLPGHDGDSPGFPLGNIPDSAASIATVVRHVRHMGAVFKHTEVGRLTGGTGIRAWHGLAIFQALCRCSELSSCCPPLPERPARGAGS